MFLRSKGQHQYWHFNTADWTGLQNFFSDFSWRDYCLSSGDVSISAERIAEVIVAGMEAYIPFSFKFISVSNILGSIIPALWPFVQGMPHIGHGKNSSSSDPHSAFISARNHCNHVIREVKHSFIQKKCDNLSSFSTNRSFWSLAKSISNNFCRSTFPSLFRSDDTIAVSPTDKATLFGSLFSSNSTLDD